MLQKCYCASCVLAARVSASPNGDSKGTQVRILAARACLETSLKFDIQIVGMHADVNIKYCCKW